MSYITSSNNCEVRSSESIFNMSLKILNCKIFNCVSVPEFRLTHLMLSKGSIEKRLYAMIILVSSSFLGKSLNIDFLSL